MIVILTVSLCLAFGAVHADDYQEYPAPLQGIVLDAANQCVKEMGLTTDVYKMFKHITETTENDDVMKKLYLCFLTKAGILDDSGHFKQAETEKYFPKDNLPLMENCNKLDEKEPANTVLAIMKCFHGQSPVKYVLVPNA